jgi:hypothetical protein
MFIWRDWRKASKYSQDSWCPSRDSNQAIPEYNSEAIQVGPMYVVSVLKGKGGRRNRKSGWGGGLGKDVTLQRMGEHGNISGLEGPHAASARPSSESMLKRG